MDLNDKAEESPDVTLIGDAQYSAYRLRGTELKPADELTDEGEFPEYGDFLAVGGDEYPERWVECPQSLARGLVELDLEPGDEFRIEEAVKRDGTWDVTVESGAEKS